RPLTLSVLLAQMVDEPAHVRPVDVAHTHSTEHLLRRPHRRQVRVARGVLPAKALDVLVRPVRKGLVDGDPVGLLRDLAAARVERTLRSLPLVPDRVTDELALMPVDDVVHRGAAAVLRGLE